jgi:transcriptional regulator with XRE-family HTH domain
MARKKAPPGSLLKRRLSKNYIEQWRLHRNDMTQERLAERVAEYMGRSFSSALLSRIENSKSPYSQRQLDALAWALDCSQADLLMRNPMEPEAPWSIWERIKPEKRRDAIRFLKMLAEDDAEAA